MTAPIRHQTRHATSNLHSQTRTKHAIHRHSTRHATTFTLSTRTMHQSTQLTSLRRHSCSLRRLPTVSQTTARLRISHRINNSQNQAIRYTSMLQIHMSHHNRLLSINRVTRDLSTTAYHAHPSHSRPLKRHASLLSPLNVIHNNSQSLSRTRVMKAISLNTNNLKRMHSLSYLHRKRRFLLTIRRARLTTITKHRLPRNRFQTIHRRGSRASDDNTEHSWSDAKPSARVGDSHD